MTNRRHFLHPHLLASCTILLSTVIAAAVPGSLAAETPPIVADPGETAPARQAVALGKADAAHLLRRAGFGGTPEQVRHLGSLPRRAAVDLLVDYERIEFPLTPYPHNPEDLRALEEKVASAEKLAERRRYRKVLRRVNEVHLSGIRRWWFRRMVATPRPLEERMTLFWHGHLVSAHPKVGWMQLYNQNLTLREHALGSFRTLLQAVSRDPAMITYLDMASNVAGKANENFARELLELFTLGPGNYTETDIKEIARAFTGHGLDAEGQFHFDPALHDAGEKTIFGKTAPFTGDDVIDWILEQPACATHLARVLYEEFVRRDPPGQRVAWLAGVIRDSRYDMRAVLRELLSSDDFFAPEARFARIKSPVELAVGAVRVLELPEVNCYGLYTLTCEMGQDVLHPPSVAGWDGDRAWITSQTLALRYNFARHLLGDDDPNEARYRQLSGRLARGRDRQTMMADVMTSPALSEIRHNALVDRPWDPRPTLKRLRLRRTDDVVEHYIERLLQQPLAPDRQAMLTRVFAGAADEIDPDDEQTVQRVRDLVALLMSMPESQVM